MSQKKIIGVFIKLNISLENIFRSTKLIHKLIQHRIINVFTKIYLLNYDHNYLLSLSYKFLNKTNINI